MALVNSTDEMREYLPLSITFDFENILPFVTQVENDILIPVLSQTLYSQLRNKIDNDLTLTDPETDLLRRCRQVICPLAVSYWMPFGQVQINSAGIQIASSTEMKTAFSWQVQKLEVSSNELGYSQLEVLHKYLLTGIFSNWFTTDEYKALTQNFINTVSSFRTQCAMLKSRYSFEMIKAIMSRIEDNQICAATGQDLYDEIKAEIVAGSISENNHLLLKYIYPAVANLTMVEAIMELTTRIDTYGVTFYTGTENSKSINKQDMPQIGILQNSSYTAGNNYLTQLSKYLQANADTYPLFKNSDAYVPPADPNASCITQTPGTYFTG